MEKYLIAAELKAMADKLGFLNVLNGFSPDIKISIPLSKKLCNTPVNELILSARSKNGILRSGAKTVGDISDLIMSEKGLKGVRNLGKKSISEIKTLITVLAYDELTDKEKAQFWLYVAENNGGLDDAEC